MPELHRPRYVEPGDRVRLDVLTLLKAREWTERAACAGEEELFGAEGTPPTKTPVLASPSELLRLLHCARCPVRRECLLEGLDPPPLPLLLVHHDVPEGASHLGTHLRSQEHVPRVWGVWGGADEHDRLGVRDLDLPGQVRELERTFPARLRARTETWRSSVRGRRSRTWRDRRIAELLGEELPPRPPIQRPVPQPAPVTAAAPRPAVSLCGYCAARLTWDRRSDASYCSARCRMAAYRSRNAPQEPGAFVHDLSTGRTDRRAVERVPAGR